MHDIVIRGGTIVDGSGMGRYRGDVGVKDGKIVEFTEFCGPAIAKLDALQDSWTEKAQLALSKDREDLAKAALVERQKAADMAEHLTHEIETLDEALKASEEDIAKLQKKLTEARREKLFDEIREKALAWCIARAEVEEVRRRQSEFHTGREELRQLLVRGTGLLEQAEEKAVAQALTGVKERVGPALQKEDFSGAMKAFAGLRAPLDTFFDKVTVNAENADLRLNRLRLLSELRRTMNGVADFDKVSGAGDAVA